jgi:glutamate dehydrogenase (NAD(P)+)
MPIKEPENFDHIAISEQQFDKAVCYIPKLKEGLIEFLKQLNRINIMNFAIEMNDGSMLSIQGYRVIHTRVFGPGKVGIRYHPDVTMEEVIVTR